MRSPLVLFTLLACFSALGQKAPAALTAADYAHAEKFLWYYTNLLVYGADVTPNWMPGDRFWYRVRRERGAEFVLVDASKGTSGPAFDHARLAGALSKASGKTYEAGKLPFEQIELSENGTAVAFSADGKKWSCTLTHYQCAAEPDSGKATQSAAPRRRRGGAPAADATVSPDKSKVAFIKDYNLWIRDVTTGAETQLSTDGVKDFGYATDNAGWVKSDRAIVLWSPNSKRIATFQQDQRGTGEMYLVSTTVGHPKLEAWKYPLPGDDVVTTIQRVVIDVETKQITRLKIEPDQHRSTLCDDITCD